MSEITYSFSLDGIIADSNGLSIPITEDHITRLDVKDPRGKGRFIIKYVEDEP
jgi:hypothetical protein